MTRLENHSLYFLPDCPYCQMVMSFIAKNHLSLEFKDKEDNGNAEELLSIGGKEQVPCLVADGKAIYESSDIISYLESKIQAHA